MLFSPRRTRTSSARHNSATGEFRAVGWEDAEDESASEDFEGADKTEDFARANIFTN